MGDTDYSELNSFSCYDELQRKNVCCSERGDDVGKKIQIQILQDEIDELTKELIKKQEQLSKLKEDKMKNVYCNEMCPNEVSRYSRQMIMPILGNKGQLELKKSKILIVGAGGLGCPCSLYLAAAGVGEIFLIDDDCVELSNIHRQVLHTDHSVGMPKVYSAFSRLSRCNPNIKIHPIKKYLTPSVAIELFDKENFDLVIDATDNVATRYLLNDVCVIKNIPLVSGSAVQMEGQLTVYNYKGGPCYRCIFPKPSSGDAVATCGDNGVLGPVPGTIGVLQALEAIKILSHQDGVASGRLLTFDASDCSFKTIKLRGKLETCGICSISHINWDVLKRFNYGEYGVCVKIFPDLKTDEEITWKNLHTENQLIVDVRQETEFKMCSLPNTINFPYDKIKANCDVDQLKSIINTKGVDKVYLLCRRGNDSRLAIADLKNYYSDLPLLVNIKGGLHAYAKEIDMSFPVY